MRAALAVRSCAGPDSAGGRAAAGKDAAERDAGVARAAGAAATEAAAPLDEAAAACDAERVALETSIAALEGKLEEAKALLKRLEDVEARGGAAREDALRLHAAVAAAVAELAAALLFVLEAAAARETWRAAVAKRRGELELAEKVIAKAAADAEACAALLETLIEDAAAHDADVAKRLAALVAKIDRALEAMTAALGGRVKVGREPRYEAQQIVADVRQQRLAAEMTQARAGALQEARCAARRGLDAEAARACMERLEARAAREACARHGEALERRLAADMCRMEMAGAYKMGFASPFDELKHDFEQWKAERDGLLETLADLSAKGAASTRACEACRDSVATRVDAATRLLAGLDVPDRLRRAGDCRSRVDAHVSSSALADVEAGVKDLEARIASVEATLRDCNDKLDALEASTLGPARELVAELRERFAAEAAAMERWYEATERERDEERAWERLRAEEASRIRGLRDDESRARAALADERAALGDLEAWCAAHLGHMMAWIDARAE